MMVLDDSSHDMDGAVTEQVCCLIEDKRRCDRIAGNASYGKKIQKTVQQRKLKLEIDPKVLVASPMCGGLPRHFGLPFQILFGIFIVVQLMV